MVWTQGKLLLSRGRFFSQVVSAVHPQYYFADVNTLRMYLAGSRANAKDDQRQLYNFVQAPHRHFFYTETVKNALASNGDLMSNLKRSPFTFIDSDIDDGTKDMALSWLEDHFLAHNDLWSQVQSLAHWRTELHTVFEAGFACYASDISPPNNQLIEPFLLINHLPFYNNFLAKKDMADILETVINLCGLEHLISTLTLPRLYKLTDYAERRQTSVGHAIDLLNEETHMTNKLSLLPR